MEKRVDSLVFRRMTYADFRHINKVGGEEQGGGGQSYIDFPVKEITLLQWYDFLGIPTSYGAGNRPVWNFQINSLGTESSQELKIYQRRDASVSIASQKIHSREANRVYAWHPQNGFPEDYDADNQNLIVYILKTTDKEYWAGWFLENEAPNEWYINSQLLQMFSESAKMVKFRKPIFIDTKNVTWPFYSDAKLVINEIPTEDDIITDFELEDTSILLQELIDNKTKPEIVSRVMNVRQRNTTLVRKLKKLYNGKCQISGETYTFKKEDGEYYCELHHLIPLGEDGSDSYANAIIVSPLIHRMLHYAKVSDIDLNKIEDGKLIITINGEEYTITWHPDHLKIVEQVLSNN